MPTDCIQLNANNNAGYTADASGNNKKIGACYNNLGQCVDCNELINNRLAAGFYWFTDENGNRIDSGYLVIARNTGGGGIGLHVHKYNIVDTVLEDTVVENIITGILAIIVLALTAYLIYRLYKS